MCRGFLEDIIDIRQDVLEIASILEDNAAVSENLGGMRERLLLSCAEAVEICDTFQAYYRGIVQRERVDAAAVIQEVIDVIERTFGQQIGSITLTQDEQVSDVYVDRRRLMSMMFDLLNNCRQAAHERGVMLEAQVHLGLRKGMLVIMAEDTGGDTADSLEICG